MMQEQRTEHESNVSSKTTLLLLFIQEQSSTETAGANHETRPKLTIQYDFIVVHTGTKLHRDRRGSARSLSRNSPS